MARLKRVQDPRQWSTVNRPTVAEEGRQRPGKLRKNRLNVAALRLFEFVNPYPWMSEPEARIQLELERRRVPFSWRWFDAPELAPNLTYLMPDFAPEFTLREYKTVIIVVGNFFGVLPKVIDRNALAATLLEADGWKLLAANQNDITRNVKLLIDTNLPELANPVFTGPQRPNPYAVPDFMASRRAMLSAQALRRRQFKLDPVKQPALGGTNHHDSGRERLRRRAGGGVPRRSLVRRSG